MRFTFRPIVVLALAPVVLFLALGLAREKAEKEFEGAVTMNMNLGGMMSVDVVTLSKAGRVRQEVSMMGQDVISIFDASAGTGLMLMPVQRTYMKLDFRAMTEQMGTMPVPTITATGTRETIVGHTCENYAVAMPTSTTEMCVATDLGFYMGSLNAQGGGLGGNASMQAYAEVFRNTFKDGFFPLRMSLTSQGMALTMTVTKIEPKSLSDEQFKLDIPDGYTEMTMPVRGGPSGGR
jgi:hypothetical protein